jgi:hypothetical protein
MNMRSYHLTLIFALALAALACEKTDDVVKQPDCEALIPEGARFFEFMHDGSGKTFLAWTVDTAVIRLARAQLDLPASQRGMHINGRIDRLPKNCALNGEWSWYFVHNDWTLAEASIELCDGEPDYVEAELDEFIRIARYCPWSSYVNREVQSPL